MKLGSPAYGPGYRASYKRPSGLHQHTCFLWRFCMGARCLIALLGCWSRAVEWIVANKSLRADVDTSPRKDIAAFISATPVTPPLAGAESAPAGGGNMVQVVAAATSA